MLHSDNPGFALRILVKCNPALFPLPSEVPQLSNSRSLVFFKRRMFPFSVCAWLINKHVLTPPSTHSTYTSGKHAAVLISRFCELIPDDHQRCPQVVHGMICIHNEYRMKLNLHCRLNEPGVDCH